MSARPVSSVEHATAFDEPHRPLSEAAGDTACVIDERKAGLIASIHNGFLSLAHFVSRYKSTMDEVNSRHQDVWNSGRPGMATRAETRVPLSMTIELFSESDELLAEATMREDPDSGALLRLKTSKMLPQRVIVRSSAEEPARTATVKWTSGASAIIEFD